jgi:hypothetical protein
MRPAANTECAQSIAIARAQSSFAGEGAMHGIRHAINGVAAQTKIALSTKAVRNRLTTTNLGPWTFRLQVFRLQSELHTPDHHTGFETDAL